jgi:hypothetical protein
VRVTIAIELGGEQLGAEEVWPDGDAPAEWSAGDVAELVAGYARRPGGRGRNGLVEFLSEWGYAGEGLVRLVDERGEQYTVVFPAGRICRLSEPDIVRLPTRPTVTRRVVSSSVAGAMTVTAFVYEHVPAGGLRRQAVVAADSGHWWSCTDAACRGCGRGRPIGLDEPACRRPASPADIAGVLGVDPAAVPELYVYDEVLAALRREQTARRNGVA